jgi:hypothetical protein
MKYLMFFATILLVSCTKSEDNDELSSNLAKWDKENIVNYEFTLTISCFCPQERVGPHLIKVVNDEIVSVNNLPYDPDIAGELMTIDQLFSYLRTVIDENPYKKTVEYNSVYGYPQFIYFDFNKNMVDEEIGYQVTGFKVI